MTRCRVLRMPNADGWWLVRTAMGEVLVCRVVMRGQTPTDTYGDDIKYNIHHEWVGPIPGVPADWGARCPMHGHDYTPNAAPEPTEAPERARFKWLRGVPHHVDYVAPAEGAYEYVRADLLEAAERERDEARREIQVDNALMGRYVRQLEEQTAEHRHQAERADKLSDHAKSLHESLSAASAREAELSSILSADRHETLVHAAAWAVARIAKLEAEREAMAEVESATREGISGTPLEAEALGDWAKMKLALAKLDEVRHGKK